MPESATQTEQKTEEQFLVQEVPVTETVPSPQFAEDEPPIVFDGEGQDKADDNIPADNDTAPEPEEGAGEEDTGEPEPEETETVFDESLISFAEQNGWTKEEVAAFGTPENFVKAVGMIGQKKAAPQPDAKPREDVVTKVDEPDFKIQLDPEKYTDEDLVSAVNQKLEQIHSHYRARTTELEQSVGAAMALVQEQQKAAEERWFDEQMNGLGDEYADLIGSGRTRDLDPKGKHYQSRQNVYREALALMQGYKSMASQNQGVVVPTAETLLKRAVHSVFADKSKTIARRQVLKKVRSDNGRFTHKPSGRQNVEMSARERAIRAVKEAGDKLGAWDE